MRAALCGWGRGGAPAMSRKKRDTPARTDRKTTDTIPRREWEGASVHSAWRQEACIHICTGLNSKQQLWVQSLSPRVISNKSPCIESSRLVFCLIHTDVLITVSSVATVYCRDFLDLPTVKYKWKDSLCIVHVSSSYKIKSCFIKSESYRVYLHQAAYVKLQPPLDNLSESVHTYFVSPAYEAPCNAVIRFYTYRHIENAGIRRMRPLPPTRSPPLSSQGR